MVDRDDLEDAGCSCHVEIEGREMEHEENKGRKDHRKGDEKQVCLQ
jgi:hypothetical protein